MKINRKSLVSVLIVFLIVGSFFFFSSLGEEEAVNPTTNSRNSDNSELFTIESFDSENAADNSIQGVPRSQQFTSETFIPSVNNEPQNLQPNQGTLTDTFESQTIEDIYIDYSQQAFENVIAQNKIPVIFFRADWCPTCRTFERELTTNPNLLRDDVVILKADYDNELDLRRQYGVTLQHTLIQLDNEGNEVYSWSGGGVQTLNDFIVT